MRVFALLVRRQKCVLGKRYTTAMIRALEVDAPARRASGSRAPRRCYGNAHGRPDSGRSPSGLVLQEVPQPYYGLL